MQPEVKKRQKKEKVS
uniref:Uncharacterized protein n=1 Tax=Anguilla anguilla TaxID=7936 RepID=A0A0E9RVH4_ANGAN